MKKLRQLYKFFIYLIKAKSKRSVHSPFVYRFITEVLKDNKHYPEYQVTRQAIAELRRSEKLIEVTDFGAFSGKSSFSTRIRRVKEIAALSGAPKHIGRLLFRMVRYYKPKFILEMGTSFGISTMSLALANTKAKLITIEGCAVTAEIAQKNFDDHHLENIHIHVGEFSIILDKVLSTMPSLDFAYIDGNHRKEPTLRYFESCLAKAHNKTIMIFDDIHWSKGMEQAWKQIKSHPQVTVSIDLFRIGIVFFRKELSKEAFVIR